MVQSRAFSFCAFQYSRAPVLCCWRTQPSAYRFHNHRMRKCLSTKLILWQTKLYRPCNLCQHGPAFTRPVRLLHNPSLPKPGLVSSLNGLENKEFTYTTPTACRKFKQKAPHFPAQKRKWCSSKSMAQLHLPRNACDKIPSCPRQISTQHLSAPSPLPQNIGWKHCTTEQSSPQTLGAFHRTVRNGWSE